jgi:peptide chain release factor 3
VPVDFESAGHETARWVSARDAHELKRFVAANRAVIAEDRAGAPVYLARNAWELQRAQNDWPAITFAATRERT